MNDEQGKPEEFVRLPGLFRRWELEEVLEVGTDFHLEEAGQTTDGTQLIAVYWRPPHGDRDAR